MTTGNEEDAPLDFLDESTSKSAQIEAAIQSEHWEDARIAIEESLAAMPADWKPIQRGVGDASTLICSFWDNAEFCLSWRTAASLTPK